MKTKKILITGVSRGLGRALSQELARQGHSIAGCARSESAIAELRSSLGPTHHFSAVDLSSDASIGEWIGSVTSEWGTPDLVINNAAVITPNAPLWEVPLADFKQLVSINITSVFSVIRHVLPSMLEQGQGVIANTSSGWGRSVSAEVAPYCASKWAIEGMTLALAQELPQGLVAVPVNPGIINTEMLQSCFGPSANDAETPDQWAKRAVQFYLGLGPQDNGQQRSI